MMALTEPHVYVGDGGDWWPAPRFHSQWKYTLPQRDEENTKPRAMIWSHRDLKAQAIDTKSADIAAVLIAIETRLILVLSVYVPQKTSAADSELQRSIRDIFDTVRATRRARSRRVEIVITGDFNRHDQLWGGPEVGLSIRQGEAERILQLMADLDLQYLGPRGEMTWQNTGKGQQSTVDIILATPELTEEIVSSSI